MFKNLNNKLKLKLLLGGVVLSLLLVYFFAIKETLQLVKDYHKKEEKLHFSKEIDTQILMVKNEIKTLDTQIGNQPDTSLKVMDLLLNNITAFCNNKGCVLKEIPSSLRAINNGYDIETYFITLEGNFKELLNLVYLLEQKKKTGGHIASLYFYTVKNNNTKKQNLLLTLYVQHYKKI